MLSYLKYAFLYKINLFTCTTAPTFINITVPVHTRKHIDSIRKIAILIVFIW